MAGSECEQSPLVLSSYQRFLKVSVIYVSHYVVNKYCNNCYVHFSVITIFTQHCVVEYSD